LGDVRLGRCVGVGLGRCVGVEVRVRVGVGVGRECCVLREICVWVRVAVWVDRARGVGFGVSVRVKYHREKLPGTCSVLVGGGWWA
jgi:hypothetical protein